MRKHLTECQRFTSERKKKGGKGVHLSKQDPSHTVYRVQVTLEENREALEEKEAIKGKFIIATNDLDHTRLPPSKFTGSLPRSTCKGQQCVERGVDFPLGFLKDPS